MDIVMIGEVREATVNTPKIALPTVLPTIWSSSALLTAEKAQKERESFRQLKNIEPAIKEKMAKNNLWNKLINLRSNEKTLLIGPLQMQLRSEEIKKANNITDKEEALEKVKIWGGYLNYLPQLFKDDEDIVAVSMVNDSYNFCYASERIRSDKETVLTLLQYNDCLYDGVSESLKEEIGENNPTFYLKSYFLNIQLQDTIPDKLEAITINRKNKI